MVIIHRVSVPLICIISLVIYFQQLVHQFQSDPNTRVAILSILAAGVVSSNGNRFDFHNRSL